MNKENVEYIHNGILFTYKNGCKLYTVRMYNMMSNFCEFNVLFVSVYK
jgi:hypothetical protein